MYRRRPRRDHRPRRRPTTRTEAIPPRARSVTFRSQATRLLWGLIGALALAGSLVLALPSLGESPPVPRPWGLWLSTNAPKFGGLNEPNWLLTMTIAADRGCRTAVVTGALRWTIKELNAVVRPQPDRYILGVEGTHVLSLETRDIDQAEPRLTEPWHAVYMSHFDSARMVEIPAPFWPNSLERAEFRLKIAAAHPAGFNSCYLTSPGIGGPREEVDSTSEPRLSSVVGEFIEAHHGNTENLDTPIALDAAIEMIVPGQEPEAALTDAAASAQPGAAVITCSTHEAGGVTAEGEIDRFGEYLRNRARRPCAGVQRFQSRNLQASLTRHTYLSGILLSAGMAMFIDALMGATAIAASRARRKRESGR
jgi:hypothetical protein